jgi:radical SAM superfamily enzyme YgiQ (UPF0313 family)
MKPNKRKIYFFKYNTWMGKHIYLPHMWYEFKRYYELNGKHSEEWEWIPPVVDFYKWKVDEIVKDAVSKNADVYMFSSYMWSWEIIKVVANAIRAELPNSILVLGGPHQHSTYTQPFLYFKEHPYFDATCRPTDYGEFFITDMLDNIAENNLDWSKVRGSYHKKGYGPEGDKKEFKYPPDIIRSNIEHARTIAEHAKNTNQMLSIMYETNRGCMYKCTYCEWGGGTNTKVIIKEMESIQDDVSFFRELNLHTLWVTDANFGILKRDPDFANLLASQNDYLRFVGITGLAKTKSAKRAAVLEPLIQAGLVTLYQISLQTIDDEILKNVERTDVTPEENVSLAKELIAKYDIDVIVELILGLPGMKVETFYKETAIEYELMNSVKPHTHHVPLYVLPDAPVGNPAYLEKFKMKLAPIAIDESMALLDDTDSKYINFYKSKNYKQENTLHIPISSYSYTVEDWKEMFFMNDMNLVLMNMVMVTPFIDILYHHMGVQLDIIFKKIYNTLSSIDDFYGPIYNEYLTPMAEGHYYNKSWRQFEVGPIKGTWTVHSAYAWLWCQNKEKIYETIEKEFSEYINELTKDCLLYCKNSTIDSPHEVVWENKYRWDLWEEIGNKKVLPVKESIQLITKVEKVDWYDKIKLYRNFSTYRKNTNDKIKMKMFQLTRAGKKDE